MSRRVPLGERVLLALSRKPGTGDYTDPHELRTPENALSLLCEVFPEFLETIPGKDVLDFGCGIGLQAVAMARAGARYVFGLETNPRSVAEARELASQFGVQSVVQFGDEIVPGERGGFDFVVTQNSMEHFPDPVQALEAMKSALGPEGKIMMVFAPPWYAPYGSHSHFFTKVPWVNIFFSESTVMAVRSNFRQDGATRYEEVEGGLNKMTVAKFERIVSSAGMRFNAKTYTGVKKLNWLTRIPLLRELFTNRISCVLSMR